MINGANGLRPYSALTQYLLSEFFMITHAVFDSSLNCSTNARSPAVVPSPETASLDKQMSALPWSQPRSEPTILH